MASAPALAVGEVHHSEALTLDRYLRYWRSGSQHSSCHSSRGSGGGAGLGPARASTARRHFIGSTKVGLSRVPSRRNPWAWEYPPSAASSHTSIVASQSHHSSGSAYRLHWRWNTALGAANSAHTSELTTRSRNSHAEEGSIPSTSPRFPVGGQHGQPSFGTSETFRSGKKCATSDLRMPQVSPRWKFSSSARLMNR